MKKKAATFIGSRPAQVLTCVLSLFASYAFGSRAIDTGSYWQYLATVVFLFIGIKYLIRSFKKQ